MIDKQGWGPWVPHSQVLPLIRQWMERAGAA